MIVSFGDKATEKFARGDKVAKFVFLDRQLKRKLLQLDSVKHLDELRIPPGNHLEKLSGNWIGFHSIRVNSQWRICFRWSEFGPTEVQIVDYH